MRYTMLFVFFLLLAATGGMTVAIEVEVCAGPDAGICGLNDVILEDFREPRVSQLRILADVVSVRDYRRVRGTLPVFDAPGGALSETTDKGFNFVTVTQTRGEWAQIGDQEWVPLDALGETVRPSWFAGVELPQGGLAFPMAWTLRHLRAASEPGGDDAPHNPYLYRYTRVSIFGCVRVDGKCWYQIGPDQWVHQHKLAISSPIARPPEVETQKWIGIDLYEQVLTAYEGRFPVFTTLISSGLDRWPTNEGHFRVWSRYRVGEMSGAFRRPDFYSLQEVPWSQYFDDTIALHGAYWHDGFGVRRSHGCVNASLTDAKWLYEWSSDSWDPDNRQGISIYVYSSGEYN